MRSGVRAIPAGARAACRWAFVSSVLLGCAAEAPATLRLVIDSDVRVPDDADEIRVTVTASRTHEGNVCEPVTRSFRLDRPGDLPLPIAIEVGSDYAEFAIYRVAVFADGAEVTRLRREGMLAWGASGVRDVPIAIDAACLSVDCLPDTEQCIAGSCGLVPYPGIFEDLSRRDRGVPCDRAAPLEDAGDVDAGAGD